MTIMPSLKIESFPQTLREIAVDRLRRAIISGHFGPGERLVERALCEQLDVSRSVVREAIRYLEAEGLVVLQPRSRPMVARLDWRFDSVLIDAANRAGDHIAGLMRGDAPSAQVIQFRPSGRFTKREKV